MTLAHFRIEIGRLQRKLKYGCGNHGCLIHDPPGQGTNMICRCSPLAFSKWLLEIAAELEDTPTEQWRETKP